MQHLQRFVLILLCIAVILVIPLLIRYQQRQHYVECWKEAQTESFLYRLCRDGGFTASIYEEFCIKMRLAGVEGEIYIQEYQKEAGMDGKSYRYPVLWEEMKEALKTTGSYSFQQDSEIRLYIGGEICYGQIDVGGE